MAASLVGGHLKRLTVLALSMIGACRATGPEPARPAVTPATAPAPACATRPLVFRPRSGIQYVALTEERRNGVYGSRLSFTPVAGGWRAVETDFSIDRPTPVEVYGELHGAELLGSAKPQYLANVTYYAFAPAGLATRSTCPGTTWEAGWQENDRTRTFRYRIESADDARVRIRVDGTVKTTHNEWRIEGSVDVSMED